ncbi:Tat pathway signal protein [Teichococcus aestuarii]|uniref:Tat pathway signal protein n=1 Tax=Teichococcus aestuarii TaxID=568898 RepID=A0A2U1V098_9PROT|nr:Tat pathway signal protein [Pseudoroseomonas aestuarii]PWC27314.1 Tat pathway signal protein [Pseudoroseomonas aestuarii]
MRALMAALALWLAAATLSPAAAQNRFWLVNQSGQTIESAYVSPSRLSNWGPDILGQSVLPPGEQVHVTPQASDCVLDIRVRYQGGREEERRNVNACSLSRVVFGNGGGAGATVRNGGGGAGGSVSRAAGDPSFSFVNRTGSVIRELYVSLSTERNWGRDRLGDETLDPGSDHWVELPSGRSCTVDMKVVYANGQSQERRGIETCSRADYGWR